MPRDISTVQKLRVQDYLDQPINLLAVHPDFSNHALRVVNRFLDLTTEELENLEIKFTGGK